MTDPRVSRVMMEVDAILDAIPVEADECVDLLALSDAEFEAHFPSKTFTASTGKTASKLLPANGLRSSGVEGTSVVTHSTTTPFISTPNTPNPHASLPSTSSPIPSKRRRPAKLIDPTKPKPSLITGKLPKTLKPWRRLNSAETFAMFDIAIEAKGDRLAFTLNLRPDREAFYRAKPCAASAILKDITRHLTKRFGRPIDIALALEETAEKRLHAHGIAGIGEDEAEAFRGACRAAVGLWKDARQYQTKTDAEIDEFWRGYCVKERHTRLSLDPATYPGRFRDRGINGRFYAVSKDVRERAEELYEAAREDFWLSTDNKAKTEDDRSLVIYCPEACGVAENPLDTDSEICETTPADEPHGASSHDDDFRARAPAHAGDLLCARGFPAGAGSHSDGGERNLPYDGPTRPRRPSGGVGAGVQHLEWRHRSRGPPGGARLLRSAYANPKSVGLMITRIAIERL